LHNNVYQKGKRPKQTNQPILWRSRLVIPDSWLLDKLQMEVFKPVP